MRRDDPGEAALSKRDRPRIRGRDWQLLLSRHRAFNLADQITARSRKRLDVGRVQARKRFIVLSMGVVLATERLVGLQRLMRA